MKWTFWLVLVAAFVLVNEYLAYWLLALYVGDMDPAGAYALTFRNAGLMSYFFAAAFRAIPFIALAWLAAKSKLNTNVLGRTILWVMLAALAAYHFFGYWSMQHSLFTPARSSSTAALDVIFIPFGALMLGCVGFAVYYVVSNFIRSRKLHG
ncbi:MAG: hypothetical protein JJU03_01645 [Idiomarina sp.]|nr:hypothetical protein [Idiomarina sp.]